MSRHCVSSCESSGSHTERKSGYTGGTNKVSLRCGFSCESSSCLTRRRTLYTWSRSKAARHCESFCDSSDHWTQRKPGDTGDRNKVYLHCEFSCESSSVPIGKRTLYTRNMSTESRQSGFFGVSSAYWIGRKICHKRCSGRSFLLYGSGGVTLSLKSKKMSSDIFCSQKASLLNESGCESLVYWN